MPTLFTIGCEGLTPDACEALLTKAGVSTVADVRRDPSRCGPGFAEARLAERLEGAGLGYVRLPGLSGGGYGPVAAEDYAVLRGLALDEDVCLMGETADPQACRRLAERLSRETGLPLMHLRAG